MPSLSYEARPGAGAGVHLVAAAAEACILKKARRRREEGDAGRETRLEEQRLQRGLPPPPRRIPPCARQETAVNILAGGNVVFSEVLVTPNGTSKGCG
jgi:hypothetical protein